MQAGSIVQDVQMELGDTFKTRYTDSMCLSILRQVLRDLTVKVPTQTINYTLTTTEASNTINVPDGVYLNQVHRAYVTILGTVVYAEDGVTVLDDGTSSSTIKEVDILSHSEADRSYPNYRNSTAKAQPRAIIFDVLNNGGLYVYPKPDKVYSITLSGEVYLDFPSLALDTEIGLDPRFANALIFGCAGRLLRINNDTNNDNKGIQYLQQYDGEIKGLLTTVGHNSLDNTHFEVIYRTPWN